MLCLKVALAAACGVLLAACGKSTSDSDLSPTGSAGSSSSVSGSGGSDDGEGTSTETTGTGGTAANASGTTVSMGAGGESNLAATDGGKGGTADSDASSTADSGEEGGTAGSGGDAWATAEEAGCIVFSGAGCGTDVEAYMVCPRDAKPGTCSECFEPTVDEQGHPYNQCSTGLLNGTECHFCCCEPSASGCEERPEKAATCQSLPAQSRLFLCVRPYEEPSGCTLAHYSTLVDEYCCP